MNTDYTIKNFRVFDKKGVTVPLRPITILTGCNSSGKSSIVKSMVLLDTFLKPLREDYQNGRKLDFTKYKLDFTTINTSMLGNFHSVLPSKSDSKKITFAYTVFSRLAFQELNVELTFDIDETIWQGVCESIVIKNKNGDIVNITGKPEGYQGGYNVEHLIEPFFRFALGEYYIVEFRHRTNEYNESSNWKSKGNAQRDEEAKDELIKKLIKYNSEFGEESFINLMPWVNAHWVNNGDRLTNQSLVHRYCKGQPQIIEETAKQKLLCYLPIVDKIAHETPDTVLKKLGEVLLDEFNVETERYQKLMDEFKPFVENFKKSGLEHFIDYYREKEKEIYSRFNDGIDGSRYSGVFQEDIGLYGKGPKDKFDNLINSLIYCQRKSEYHDIAKSYYFDFYQFYVYDMFEAYLKKIKDEVLAIAMPHFLSYMGSTVVEVKRIYNVDNNDDFARVAYSYFEAQQKFKNCQINGLDYGTIDANLVFHKFISHKFGEEEEQTRTDEIKTEDFLKRNLLNFAPGEFINKWIQAFGLGHSAAIQMLDDNMGITIRLHQNKEDEKGRLLADEGYGVSQLLAMLFRIETAIMSSPLDVERKYTINAEYFWPTQDISTEPETIKEKMQLVRDPYTIAIEEPEVHLHPRFQSLLADMIVDAYKTYNVHFIVETHSEYLIRKLQTLIGAKGTDLTPKEVSIIYVYPHDEALRPAGEPQVKVIEVEADGTFSTSFGSGFFDEADALALELMKQNLN